MKKIFAVAIMVIMTLALAVNAFANVGFDAMYADVNVLQWNEDKTPNAGLVAAETVEIEVGQKLYILGWFAQPGKTVDKVVWTLDGEEKECADNYRDRTEIITVPGFKEAGFAANDFIKSGFGHDDAANGGLMELLGVDALTDGTYKASILGKFTDGTTETIKAEFTLKVGTGEASAPAAGEIRDFSKEKGDALSYDWILINGEKVADGNEEVIAKKQLIDGSDESVNTIGMRGWYGNANSKVASYGYMIDDNDPVYGEFKVEAEDAVIAAGGDSRFVVTVDVSELKDGETHKIRVVAKLENGDIVILNRNESGKDRDIYVNYKAPASQTAPETDEPAPQTDEPAPQTGDATVAMFAVVLVAVMGAAVVFSKKRAF